MPTPSRLAIGLDLGGTFIKAGLVTERGESLGGWKEPTGAAGGPAAILNALFSVTHKILDSDALKAWKARGGADPVGIGIGSPGIIDPVEGVALSATANLPGWKGTKIGPDFQREFGLRAFLDNDANAYAWGEFHFGPGKERNSKVLLALTLGTGVGGGVVIDGRLFHGAHSCGGELGHIPISETEDAPPCSCGRHGCLESYVSAPSLVRYTLEQRDKFPGSRIFTHSAHDPVTAQLIHDAANTGDPLALQVVDRFAHYLGRGLSGLVSGFDPDIIVLGGGVAHFLDLTLPRIRDIVRQRVFFSAVAPVDILPARLGSEEGYLGAAALALFPPM